MSPVRRLALRALLFALLAFSVWLFATVATALAARDFPFVVRPYLTLIGTVVLAAGSLGALGNKTWGILLALVGGLTFGGVWAAGVAPLGYLTATALSVGAFALVAPELRRHDARSCTLALASVGLAGAAAVALAGPGVRALF